MDKIPLGQRLKEFLKGQSPYQKYTLEKLQKTTNLEPFLGGMLDVLDLRAYKGWDVPEGWNEVFKEIKKKHINLEARAFIIKQVYDEISLKTDTYQGVAIKVSIYDGLSKLYNVSQKAKLSKLEEICVSVLASQDFEGYEENSELFNKAKSYKEKEELSKISYTSKQMNKNKL